MCKSFSLTQNKSPQLFHVSPPSVSGEERKNSYHKSPVLGYVRYATIIPLTDKSISPPSDNISDYLCYGNNVRLLREDVWCMSGKGASGSPELHLICCCLWVRGIVEWVIVLG